MLRLVVLVLMACCVTVSSAGAQDQQEAPAESGAEAPVSGAELRLPASASVGYGVDAFNPGDANPYALTVRPRLGLTLPEGIYLGGLVNLGLGEQVDATVYDPAMMLDVDAGTLKLTSFYIGVEVGGDIEVGKHLIVRPTYGMGSMKITGEACGVDGMCKSEYRTYPSLQFGLQLMLRFGVIYGGVDLAYMMVPNKETVNPADQAFVGITIGAMPGFSI